jgi:hypothetical protein
VFFGAALYISLVQHPAALETGNDFAARFFPPMYGRASVLQASLAVIGCMAAIAAWLRVQAVCGWPLPFSSAA